MKENDAKAGLLEQQRKAFAVACLNQSLAIAQKLYDSDKPRYKVLFGWINLCAKHRKSPALVLQTLKRLAEKEASDQKATDVVQYLGGTLRKLEQEREAKRLRKGQGASRLGDVLDAALRKAQREKPDDEPDDAA